MSRFFASGRTIIKIKNEVCCIENFHYDIEFVYILNGRYRAISEGTVYELEAGDAFISFPFDKHSYERDGDNRAVMVICSPDMLGTLKTHFTEWYPADRVIRHGKLAPGFGETIERLARLAAANTHFDVADPYAEPAPPDMKPFVSDDIIMSYLRSIFREILGAMELSPLKRRKTENIERVLLCCSRKLCDFSLSLASVSEETGLSCGHITRLLNENYNMGFTDLIHMLRTDRAKHLLKNTSKTIAEIAYESGFSTLRSFNRVFMQVVGMTPRDFRTDLSDSHADD